MNAVVLGVCEVAESQAFVNFEVVSGARLDGSVDGDV